MHLIGHSFGAHIASSAANLVHQVTKEKVYRVTGLDVGLLWELRSLRFYKNVAQVVDAVHTSSPVQSSPYSEAMVDFYVNGGSTAQPGCKRIPDMFIDDFYDFARFGKGLCGRLMSIHVDHHPSNSRSLSHKLML